MGCPGNINIYWKCFPVWLLILFLRLSADDYVHLRMLPLLAEISVATPMISIYIYVITIVGAILSVISSALSTFGYSVFIPAALAISGAIAAWGSYHQLEQKLFKKNVAAHQLRCVSKVILYLIFTNL